jgi:hypothetical protein
MDSIILVSLTTPNLMSHNRTFYISLILSADDFASVSLTIYVTIPVMSSVKYATPLPISSQKQLQNCKVTTKTFIFILNATGTPGNQLIPS